MDSQTPRAGISVPYEAIHCLYRNGLDHKVVCEIDIDMLKQVNASVTIDEIVAEAEFDYATGKASGPFTSADDLMKSLGS